MFAMTRSVRVPLQGLFLLDFEVKRLYEEVDSELGIEVAEVCATQLQQTPRTATHCNTLQHTRC